MEWLNEFVMQCTEFLRSQGYGSSDVIDWSGGNIFTSGKFQCCVHIFMSEMGYSHKVCWYDLTPNKKMMGNTFLSNIFIYMQTSISLRADFQIKVLSCFINEHDKIIVKHIRVILPMWSRGQLQKLLCWVLQYIHRWKLQACPIFTTS